MKKILFFSLLLTGSFTAKSQERPYYWQQHVDYKMDVTMNVKNYNYQGTQELVYTNNSPDTLKKVFYHLYPNAFQPGSEMDLRLQNIKDPDGRMVKTFKTADKTIKESRIKTLKPDEIGFLKITNFMQDGTVAQTKTVGTVLEVTLAHPLLPKQKTTFTLNFDGQVPVQIRRSGRNNSEGVELSMTQWYPKLAEYDFEGWHADPYIGREFQGVWGNFDVKITLDKAFTIGGSGYLQNKNEIGHGYEDKGTTVKTDKKAKTLTWHFIAPNVHDFAWAADKNYVHDTAQVPNGATLHFFYKNDPKIMENWKKMEPKAVELMEFYNQIVGKYPYEQYSVIQGGDGGMEYAMCTLIVGSGSFEGLVGVTAHEMGHSWFQHVLATNESKHSWMDEGFTTFIEDLGVDKVLNKKSDNPFKDSYKGYINMANSGKEQPQGTHADRYDENRLYSISSYSKGSVFLSQLGYLIGYDKLMETLKRYYSEFKFTHPTPNDFKRVAEKVSGAELDWYLMDWTETTNTIDYGIKEVKENEGKTTIALERIGRMPMPQEVYVKYKDGSEESFYIPLRMMNFVKENPFPQLHRTVLGDWFWGNPNYEFTINRPKSDIEVIVLDPTEMTADVKRENNIIKL